jgi:hypothetical protein
MEKLKQLIKELGEEQRSLKLQRKTGTITLRKVEYDWGSYNVPTDECQEKVTRSRKAQEKIQSNKPRITAALNLYHELRGSEYRHNVSEETYWLYKQALRELKEKYATELT